MGISILFRDPMELGVFDMFFRLVGQFRARRNFVHPRSSTNFSKWPFLTVVGRREYAQKMRHVELYRLHRTTCRTDLCTSRFGTIFVIFRRKKKIGRLSRRIC